MYPRRPNKSHVRYYGFDWQHIDILVGKDADTTGAQKLKRPGRMPPPPGTPQPPGQSTAPAHARVGMAKWQAPLVPPWGQPDLRADQVAAGGDAKAGDTEKTGAKSDANDAGTTGKTGAPSDTAPAAAKPAPPTVTPPPPPPTADTGAAKPAPPPAVTPPKKPGTPATVELPAKPPAAASPWQGKLGPKTGGVRLFFYKRETRIAERAAGFITQAYRYLVGKFHYVPTKTFPYILYSSYTEFLETNLFPLQEGVLGVTSPKTLQLTLPYFGDHRMFEHVSTHEMTHQFFIQKIRDISKKAKLWGDPMQAMPLWFTEGIAEYYSQHGINPAAEMEVRDIVDNPDVRHGYAMLGFFDDRPGSVLWTYQVGQVRCAFLEDTYGKGTLQKIIDDSPLLIGSYQKGNKVGGFAGLLKRITGDDKRVIAAKFDTWIKHRSYRTALASTQGAAQLEPLKHWEGRLTAMTASPDGHVMLYRTFDLTTGQSRLVLVDPRAPKSTVGVVADGMPGTETLHPVDDRNFALSDHALVYVAQSQGADVLFWQTYKHTAKKPKHPKRRRDSRFDSDEDEGPRWDVSLSLGHRSAYHLADKGIIAIQSPSLSPDGRRVAFVGLSRQGQKDLYLLQPLGDGYRLTRLTHDAWGERALWWGPNGIVFTSDATHKERYNLFRLDPDHPQDVTRVTTEDRDEQSPMVTPDGRIFFVAYDHARADVYEVKGDEIVRRTDVDTGVFDLAPGPDGGLWSLWYHSGQRRPTLVKAKELLALDQAKMGEPGTPFKLPDIKLGGATAYNPLRPKNWDLGNLFGFFGAGAGGIFGQVVASAADQMRNQGLILNVFVYGSLDLTDGYLFYIDQQHRLTWGGGPFQSLDFRVDQTFPKLPVLFTSGERFYGLLGSLRYPFNTFEYLQGNLSLGGVNYFLNPDARLFLASGVQNGTGRNLVTAWDQLNGGARFQAEGTLRLGYDTIRYNPRTGPIAGSSAMLEVTADAQPFNGHLFGNLRLDAEHYLPLFGETNVFIRGGAGTGFGGRLARQFYLSSFDTIRGVPFGDSRWLLGKNFFFATAELQIPMDQIIQFILFSNIEAIVGVDFGGVSDQLDQLWNKRVLDFVLGVNFGFGPLVFRLHFAKPVDTGAKPVVAGQSLGLPNNGNWVTNFSLGYLYY